MSTDAKPLCITVENASTRYGYSKAWFDRARWAGNGPPFLKLNSGRILYPLIQTDEWFTKNGLKNSTSEYTKDGVK